MKAQLLLLLLIVISATLPGFLSASGDTTSVLITEKPNTEISAKEPGAFLTEAGYIGDVYTNIAGGHKTGLVYLGMANLKIGMDTKNAGLWEGGQFFINGAATHGQSPSEMLTGDFQGVSNIEAGDHIYLHEFWYRHTFSRFEITIGIQDLNVEFAGSENGSMFINSSFGIPPVIADNTPVPIFPLTGAGVTGKLRLSEAITLSSALYDGCPTQFDKNVYNISWHLNPDDGILSITEVQWTGNINKLPGSIKAGYYYHSGLKVTDQETGIKSELFNKNYGIYLIADQALWKDKKSNRGLGLFAQLALSPANINNHHSYIGGGFNYTGFSEQQPEDACGIAFASAGFHQSGQKDETTIELYYKKQIGENLFLQPDLQYVINPAGNVETLPNALVGILRFSLNF
jgi:porin